MGNWKLIRPEGRTNFISNPSFELTTTGYAASGTNTIARSTAQSIFGSHSCLATYQDNTTLLSFTSITLTAVAHHYSAWVRLPSNWDGGAVRLAISGFTSAVTNTATTTTTVLGKWILLEMNFTPDAGDLSGQLLVQTASAPTAGRAIHIDGLQCEVGTYGTTYIDGDQPGCKWNGARHNGISTRNSLSREGGKILDLATDLEMAVDVMSGVGMPLVTNVATSRALVDGSLFQRTRVNDRIFQLRHTVMGDTMADYHDLRQAFIEAIGPDALELPIIFRYDGATIQKEIKARFDSGLELTGPDGFAETVALRLIAHDPYWQQLGESSAALDTNDSATFQQVAARIDGQWNVMGPPDAAGTYASVRAVVVSDTGSVIFGGDFTNFDNIAAADYVTRWNKVTQDWEVNWSTGFDGIVYALAKGADGTVYAGGAFTVSGATTLRGIAKLTTSEAAWDSVGPPSSGGTVRAIAIGLDGTLFVGGEFDNFDGTANADRIAKWNGTAWSALGTGANGNVLALAVAPSGDLYVGGAFTTIGGVACARIAKWDGSAFTALGSGCDNTVQFIVIDESGVVYVGGLFTTADGMTVNGVAKWNGLTFEALGEGVASDTQVDAMALWRGDLIIVGPFTEAGGSAVSQRIAAWNGSNWYHLDIEFPSAASQGGIAVDDDDLYVGLFTSGTGNYAGLTTVTPAGNAKVWPVLVIKRVGGTSAKLLSVQNETTGKRLLFNYDLLDGEELVIDLRPDKRSMKSSFFGNRWKILPNSDVANFFLLPEAQNVTAFIDVAGSPTIEAFVRWRDNYWSVD